MDPALRALADHAESTADGLVRMHLALTSGHTVFGTLIPNDDFEPVIRGRLGQGEAARGRRKAAPTTVIQEGDHRRHLLAALRTPAGGDTMTVGEAIVHMPGGGSLAVPVMRVASDQVTAWWVVTDGAA